jgi:hypothetical protein
MVDIREFTSKPHENIIKYTEDFEELVEQNTTRFTDSEKIALYLDGLTKTSEIYFETL